MEFLITAAVFAACWMLRGYRYRRSRGRGRGIWVSMRGPSGTTSGRRF